MNYNNKNEVQRMQDLINYGLNEEEVITGGAKPILEYSQKAADGKVYGIIKECQKFYIKVAPNKDTKLVAEDYDYIGGYMNKKENEYGSYALASKQFDLKMMAINEANATKVEIEQFKPVETSEWQINETKEMRAELNRFRQITNNIAVILNEEKDALPAEHTLPEAPASNPSEDKVNSPFTDTAVADGDKDFKKTQESPQKAGCPFDTEVKISDADLQTDKKASINNVSDTYTEKAKFAPDNAVVSQNPSGGKVTKVSENKKRCIKLTEEQLLAWNNSKDYMDKSKGTEIGDTTPYSEEAAKDVTEEIAVHNTDNQNTPLIGNGKIGSTAPYDNKVNEDTVDVDKVAGMPDDDDEGVPFPEVEDGGAYLDFEKDYNKWDDKQYRQNHINDFDHEISLDDFDYEIDLDDDAYKAASSDSDFYESKERNFRRNRRISETEMHDFGKHPSYHKSAMNIDNTKEVSVNGAKDWNDSSVASEDFCGKKVGSSAPYDKMIDQITRSIMKQLNFPKKA